MSHLLGPVDLCNSQVKTDEMQDSLSQNLKSKLFPNILESALDPLCMEIDRWKLIDTSLFELSESESLIMCICAYAIPFLISFMA